jgi:hypothetical protein
LFYSSGIFEAVYGGQNVINIKLPLNTWRHDSKKLGEYFNGDLYNYAGVVKSVDQDSVLNKSIKIDNLNLDKQIEWINRFIGAGGQNSAHRIAIDILQ